ncbi:unnamed protein product [Schistosoma mattheei]|uniref:Uncharacterized protein n=1 Tax=Schistosoma mattheei TaxID=31246 RepID=A0AA85C363_9TREM|nr:unnamed protein product [Schistosoma mattheei]
MYQLLSSSQYFEQISSRKLRRKHQNCTYFMVSFSLRLWRRTKLHQNHPPELQIFSTISKSYERNTLLVVRKWENFAKRQASTREQLYFLHECLRQHVLPTSVRYRPPINCPLGWKIAEQSGRKMVHLMITDAHYRIRKYQHVIEDQKMKLQRTLTSEHLEILTTAIEISCKRHREQRRNALKKKLIKISKPPMEENTNNCVINLSKQPLTNTEEHLLQKGLNYNTSDASKLEFFAALESSLKTSGISEETQQEIRQTIVPITQQVKENNQLTPQEQKALKELRNRKDIVIIPADKGRTTVIMDKEEYVNKAEELLEDKSTYKLMDTNPVKKLDKDFKQASQSRRNNKTRPMENEIQWTSTPSILRQTQNTQTKHSTTSKSSTPRNTNVQFVKRNFTNTETSSRFSQTLHQIPNTIPGPN